MGKTTNNLKQIREIYGITQEEISQVVGVSRTTVSQWENGITVASSANLEKLSIFYGIGPEAFYEIDELDENYRRLIIESAIRAREIEEESQGERSKINDFKRTFENISFKAARSNFMMSMKMLLAAVDYAETLEDLEIAYDINQKMAKRLKAMIDIRKIEEEAKKTNNEDTLFDLIDKFLEE